MRPRKMLTLNEDVHTKLAAALVTRFSPLKGPRIPIPTAKKYVPTGAVLQWGRVQISEGGDRMCCREMIKPGSLGRDCTYVRVCPSVTHTCFRCLMLLLFGSMKQLLTATQDLRTSDQTWCSRRFLENSRGLSRSTYQQHRSSTSSNRMRCSSQLSSSARQHKVRRGFGSTPFLVDLRRLTSDSFSVLLAGFLTGGSGSSLTGVGSVHMRILRQMHRSEAAAGHGTRIH